jgi:tetratricopeptide (TPR) repeat protein
VRRAVFAFFAAITVLAAGAEERPAPPITLGLNLAPWVAFPIGADASLFRTGGGASVRALVGFPRLHALKGTAGLEFLSVPVRAASRVNLLGVGVGADASFAVLPRLDAWIGAEAGYSPAGLWSEAFLGDDVLWGGYPFVTGRAGLTFHLDPSWSLGAGFAGCSFIGLLTAAGVSIHATYDLASRWQQPLSIERLSVEALFPAMYLAYGREPPATVTVRNAGRFPVTDVEAGILVDPYMSRATVTKLDAPIESGGRRDIPLGMIFTDRILGVIEGTSFPAKVTIAYSCAGQRRELSEVVIVDIRGRNSLTWEDDRKAALFVSQKDPEVLRFAGAVTSAVRASQHQPLTFAFRAAAAVHAALREAGMSYVVDPASPYEALAKNRFIVDFLKFPRQTLACKAGDCDDLTILYCALLESMGVETAFVLVPGHILPAVSLDLSPALAEQLFEVQGDLIMEGSRSWLPVESTALSGGFLEAWHAGAELWRRHTAAGDATLLPVREAWKSFPPVSLSAGADQSSPPAREGVARRYDEDMASFIDRDVDALVARLHITGSGSGVTSSQLNKVGVLYARYGLYEKAEGVFRQILDAEPYVPALQNLGTIARLRGRFQESLDLFSRALEKGETSPSVLLGLVQACRGLGLDEDARRYFERLRTDYPDVAARNASLAVRASSGSRETQVGSTGPEVTDWLE